MVLFFIWIGIFLFFNSFELDGWFLGLCVSNESKMLVWFLLVVLKFDGRIGGLCCICLSVIVCCILSMGGYDILKNMMFREYIWDG